MYLLFDTLIPYIYIKDSCCTDGEIKIRNDGNYFFSNEYLFGNKNFEGISVESFNLCFLILFIFF